jgi:N-acetylglucosamine-6-phosphate deacetylase
MRAAGMPDGAYDLGGTLTTVTGGIARTPAGGLAGSTLTLNQAVRNAVEFAGLPLGEALAMATTTPAASLGLAGRKGRLAPGADADLVIVDSELNVYAAMVAGALTTYSL